MDNFEAVKELLGQLDNNRKKTITEMAGDPDLLARFALLLSDIYPQLNAIEGLNYLENYIRQIKQRPKIEKESEILTSLQLKEIEAPILKSLVSYFKNEPIEKIIRDSLSDEEKPENPFVIKLSEHSKRPGRPEFYHDLVFKVKLPEKSQSKYAYIIVGMEPQNYKTSYPLKVRALLYTADLFIGENQWLELAKVEKLYKGAVPVFCIFLNSRPNKKDANTILGQKPNRKWKKKKMGS